MAGIGLLPELRAWDSPGTLIRIPEQVDVPLSPRIARLIDTAPFRRLASIRQLGFVALVYPGATHSRFEHSLGVYRNALLFLRQLSTQSDFSNLVDQDWAERFLVAALFHDLGHWPYCHPIEDLNLAGVAEHETLARENLTSTEVSDCLQRDWGMDPDSIATTLAGRQDSPAARLVGSMLSGPIDVDKMDYLVRDSLHCGVPYGRNFDSPRLISSLCLNRTGDGIGISSKGRTAAELMVFARYVMFSEVYWHHAVRRATAMFQRAFFELQSRLDLPELQRTTEERFAHTLLQAAAGSSVQGLCDGLFGPRRILFKRWAQFNYFEKPAVFGRLARQPFSKLVNVTKALADILSTLIGQRVAAEDVLLDAPPLGLEVQFEIDVWDEKQKLHRPLGVISPVVQSLARVQFDDYVKQVRIFLHPRWADSTRSIDAEPQLVKALELVGL